MKIALMNEFSQAAKNPIVLEQLELVANEQNHQVFNVGMDSDNDHRLTYIHLGIMASLLLNSKAVDFVVTGCGTGQGALMAAVSSLVPTAVIVFPQLSVAVGKGRFTVAVQRPASVLAMISAGQVMLGSCASVTMTSNIQLAIFPA